MLPAPVPAETLLAAFLVAAVALVHPLSAALPLSRATRAVLLSAAGGVSLVYAFLHLFPELDARRESLGAIGLPAVAEGHVYAVVFAGLALFYGLERLAAVSREHEFAHDWGSLADEPVFWVHVGGFVLYNAFIGYVLVQGETGTESTVLFAVAMALHLLGNDAAMEAHHREAYERIGRWLLAAAVVAGGLLGAVYTINAGTVTLLLGLLTGGIVFNAIKDELPRTRESRFWAFAAGSGVYAALVLAL